MQLTGPPAFGPDGDKTILPYASKAEPLQGRWYQDQDLTIWRKGRDGVVERVGEAHWRGEWIITWEALTYQEAMEILFRVGAAEPPTGTGVSGASTGAGTFLFTPRTREPGDPRAIDTNNDGRIDAVLEEVEIPCRLIDSQPSTSAIYRRVAGEYVARLQLTFRSVETYPQRAGFGYPESHTFNVTAQEDGAQLRILYDDASGTPSKEVTDIIVSQNETTIDILDHPADIPYTFTTAGTYQIAALGRDFSDVAELRFGFPGNANNPPPGTDGDTVPDYFWTYPSDLEVLTDIKTVAGDIWTSTLNFGQIEVNDPGTVEQVGISAGDNAEQWNVDIGGDVQTDIFDKYPNLRRFNFQNWARFKEFDVSTMDLELLLSYQNLREILLDGNASVGMFTNRNLAAFPNGATEIDVLKGEDYAPSAAGLSEPYLREWVRVQSHQLGFSSSTEASDRNDYARDLFRSRIHLGRFAPQVGPDTATTTYADVRDGTGSFAHAYDSHDATAETISFAGDLRTQSYTIEGVTFGDDAFPDPQDSSATDPDGIRLWSSSADTDFIVRGTAGAPGERLFYVVDDAGQGWIMSTVSPGTVNAGPVTQVTLGAEGTQAKIWKEGETRSNISPGTYDLDSPTWGPSAELRDGLSGAGLIV